MVRTGAKAGESADRILTEVLEKAGLRREQLSWIVSTGYGRVSIPYADENVTEISCHGRGAHYFNPDIRTILDIGGQDSKAIRLKADGEVADFVMNDKCAAGTGRFLEMIARTLEVDIDDLGPIALQSTEEIEITSMCSVFAESEVISLIANNKEKADIANGICPFHRGQGLVADETGGHGAGLYDDRRRGQESGGGESCGRPDRRQTVYMPGAGDRGRGGSCAVCPGSSDR